MLNIVPTLVKAMLGKGLIKKIVTQLILNKFTEKLIDAIIERFLPKLTDQILDAIFPKKKK